MLEQRIESPPIDPGELRRSVRMLRELGDRMTRIVRTVRSLARDVSGDPFESVALAQMIRDVLFLAEERLRKLAVAIRLGPVAEDLRVECRGAQISQVLLNLIGNAADAVRDLPERWIELDVREKQEAVEIAVTDSGAGIPVAIRERIMAPFFTTKPPGQGTGLGLSISRALVEAHGGSLRIDPLSAHTRFVVWLPRRQPAGAPRA
jgi:C4-dicarboxylate-specific signal transduction histidine kinase